MNLFYVQLPWIFVAAQTFSMWGKWGLLSRDGAEASHCGGSFCHRACFQSVQISVAVARGLGSACSVVVAHELSCRWNLPRPGIESGSSAQAVRLSTTGASGESQEGVYDPLQPAGLHPWYSLNVITYSLPSCSLHT